ncbi:helix-turn-helix domain-containing protein [Shinella sumterensis]|uniref:Helix-turn-helix domain-containing protein n=1 Tax=Shinella sumterensis TaxID=1967501 RepID=A0AA50CQS5_9HYPH|nr:helix-turn-helix domain-containing protein [Shinella sumterensis]WLR98741.1 helix-turn-helix domain-containing protein [Shinella sumterensis]
MKTAIHWSQRPLLPLDVAAGLLGISRSGMYRLVHKGDLVFTKVGGRTVVRTKSLQDYLESREDWSPVGEPDAKAVRA